MIVVNKNFTKRYIHRYFQRLFIPENNLVDDNNIRIFRGYYNSEHVVSERTLTYSNLLTGQATTVGVFSQMHFCNEYFMDIIDTIITTFNNGGFNNIDINSGTTGIQTINLNLLLNTILCKETSKRDNALQWLVNNNIITQALRDRSITFTTPVKNYRNEYSTWVFDPDTNVFTFKYDKPIELLKYYVQTRDNLAMDDLYLFYSLPTSHKLHSYSFTGADWWVGNSSRRVAEYETNIEIYYLSPSNTNSDAYPTIAFSNFYSKTASKTVYDIPYVAIKISNTAGNGEIKFDHTDKISYFDNITVKLKLPKEIS